MNACDFVSGNTKNMQTNTTNFGAVVGRVANRIRGAQFTLNGTVYKLVPNYGKTVKNSTIHGMCVDCPSPSQSTYFISPVYLIYEETCLND